MRGMSHDDIPILYTKTGCPWCEQAMAVLESKGLSYRNRVVTDDEKAFAEMREKSGQSSAPVLDWHGHILADFGEEELIPFLRAQNVEFEDS